MRRWITVATLVAGAAGGLYVARVYTEFSALMEWRKAALSSSIFAAPHQIRAGDDLEASGLPDRLASLHYTLVDNPSAPGQYSRSGADLTIYLRGYAHGPASHEASLVRVKVEKGRIAAVTDAGGMPARHATLEPEAIGRLEPGAPAERIEVRLEDQKPYLVEGLLATEDQFFYWHPGFNPARIVSAAIADLRAGRLAQGASTLTQQLARTFLERRERSFSRKLHELAAAIVLEIKLTKDEILQHYINDVALGAYAGTPLHGMPQAARYFFGKDLSQVTPEEAATLIGMVQAPTLYDPRRHPEASTKRRDVVLGIMRSHGVIDEATYAAAVASPIKLGKPPVLRRAPYFTDYVIMALGGIPGIGDDLSGLKVFTTLDSEVQDRAAEAVRTNIERLEKSYRALRPTGKGQKLQSAAAVLDARTGGIRALIGGRSYAESQYNRAAFALRQPGSAFKPIVYLAAMDPRRSPISPALTLATLLPDEPMSFGGWSPENHEHRFRLRATAATALADSLNVPAAYLGSRVGPDRIVTTAHELGMPQDLQPLLPIAIGAEETTLLDLTSVYQVLAGAGVRAPVYSIESVVDASGKEIYRHPDVSERVVDEDVAYLVTSGLQMVMTSGTGASASRMGLKVPAAGKTGTTQDYKDAWFVGYTPHLVCGVWLGFDTPKSTGLTGAQAALPAWVKIVQGSSTAGAEDFPMPDGIETAVIDPDSGGLATPACSKRVRLPFLEGTSPSGECTLHGGFDVAASPDGWGGWEGSVSGEPAPQERKPERTNVFKKVGKFFGGLFRR